MQLIITSLKITFHLSLILWTFSNWEIKKSWYSSSISSFSSFNGDKFSSYSSSSLFFSFFLSFFSSLKRSSSGSLSSSSLFLLIFNISIVSSFSFFSPSLFSFFSSFPNSWLIVLGDCSIDKIFIESLFLLKFWLLK